MKIKIHQQLSYDYPFKVNTMKPSKQSVSELKRQLETEESNTNYDEYVNIVLVLHHMKDPSFLPKQKENK